MWAGRGGACSSLPIDVLWLCGCMIFSAFNVMLQDGTREDERMGSKIDSDGGMITRSSSYAHLFCLLVCVCVCVYKLHTKSLGNKT